MTKTTNDNDTDTDTDRRPDKPTAIVLVSGGMDSATAVAEAIDRDYDPIFLHTSYGQRTENRELECARELADHYDAGEFVHVETDHLATLGGSSLTNEEMKIPDADPDAELIPSTYVPFRNANLLSMAVSCAEDREADAVVVGAHSEDYAGYPDCRPEFFEAFQAVADVGTAPETQIDVLAPFVDFSKTDVARRGLELDVPYESTWSCYRENEPACGTCDSCAYRLAAFQRLGERDPIEYETRLTYI